MREIDNNLKAKLNELRQLYPQKTDNELLSVLNDDTKDIKLTEKQKISILSENTKKNTDKGITVEKSKQTATSPKQSKIKEVLQARVLEVNNELKNVNKNDGFIGKTWSWMKNNVPFLDRITDSSNEIKVAQEKELENLKNLTDEEAFKALTGLEYTPENWQKFEKGEIQLGSETALNGYKEGQEFASEFAGDMVAGILAVGVYTLAVAAAPISGGASIMLGFGLATAIGGGTKVGIRALDAATAGKNYTTAKSDFLGGAFSGALSPFTGGTGGAAGRLIATKLGMQAIKEVGKTAATSVAKSGFKEGLKTALTNPTGYKYIGGNLGKKAIAYGTEMAVDGTMSGTIDNTFRTAVIEDGDANEVANAALSGFIGGLGGSLAIGGGMKLTGKMGNWVGNKLRIKGGEEAIQKALPAPTEGQVLGESQKALPAPTEGQVFGESQKALPAPTEGQVLGESQKALPAPTEGQVFGESQKALPAPTEGQVFGESQKALPAPKKEDINPITDSSPNQILKKKVELNDDDITKIEADAKTVSTSKSKTSNSETPNAIQKQNIENLEEESNVHFYDVKEDVIARQRQVLKQILKDEDINNRDFKRLTKILEKYPTASEEIISILKEHPKLANSIIDFVEEHYDGSEQAKLIMSKIERLDKQVSYNSRNRLYENLKKYPMEKLEGLFKLAEIKDKKNDTPLMRHFERIANDKDIIINNELIDFIERTKLVECYDISFNHKELLELLKTPKEKLTLITDLCSGKNHLSTLSEYNKLKNCDEASLKFLSQKVKEESMYLQKVPELAELKDVEHIKLLVEIASKKDHTSEFMNLHHLIYSGITEIPKSKLKLLANLLKSDYDMYDIKELPKQTEERLKLITSILEIRTNSNWSNKHPYKYNLEEIAEMETPKLEAISKLATAKRDDEYIYSQLDVSQLFKEPTEKVLEIQEYLAKNKYSKDYSIDDLLYKDIDELKALNGKCETVQKADWEVKLEEKIKEYELNYLGPEIKNICKRADGKLDENSIELAAELNIRHYSLADIKKVLSAYKDKDGVADFEKYKQIGQILDNVFRKTHAQVWDTNDLYCFAAKTKEPDIEDFFMTVLDDSTNWASAREKIFNVVSSPNITSKTADKIFKNLIKFYSKTQTPRCQSDVVDILYKLTRTNAPEERIAKFVEYIAQSKNGYDLERTLYSITPELIDNDLTTFKLIDALKKCIDRQEDIKYVIENFKTPPTQTQLEAIELIAKTYDHSKEGITSPSYYYIKHLLEEINDTNIVLLRDICEKFNGEDEFILTREHQQISMKNIIRFNEIIDLLRITDTPDKVNLLRYALKKDIGLREYENQISTYNLREVVDNSTKYPKSVEFAIEYDVEKIVKDLGCWNHMRSLGKIENEIISDLTPKHKSALAKILSLKDKEEYIFNLEDLDSPDKASKIIKSIKDEQLEVLTRVAETGKITQILELYKAADKIKPEKLDLMLKLINIADKKELNEYRSMLLMKLADLTNVEETFGNKEIYDLLIEKALNKDEIFNFDIIGKILRNPYNENSWKYIMKEVDNPSGWYEFPAIVNAISLNPENIENLEFLKTSTNVLGNREFLNEFLPNLTKDSQVLFAEMVNELKTHNDKLKYQLDYLFRQKFEFKSSEEIENFKNLYRLYDENGEHAIPQEKLYPLSQDATITNKILGNTNSNTPKLDLEKIKITQEMADNFIQEAPDIYKILLYDENGEFTVNSFKEMLTKMNNSEFLRDALVDFETSGKIDLSKTLDEEISVYLIKNDTQLINALKSIPELLNLKPQFIKQTLNQTNSILDIVCNKIFELISNNPSMFANVNRDTLAEMIAKEIKEPETTARTINIVQTFGGKNIQKLIEATDARDTESILDKIHRHINPKYKAQLKNICTNDNITFEEFKTIIHILDLTESDQNRYGYTKSEIGITEEDLIKILDKINAKGYFDSKEVFENVYKTLLDTNLHGFEEMTQKELEIAGKYNLLTNENINASDWKSFTQIKPKALDTVAELTKTYKFENIKLLLNINDEEIAKLNFKEKMDLLETINGIDDEVINKLEKYGYNIRENVSKFAKSLSVEQKHMVTDSAKQTTFIRKVLANNNPKLENLLKNIDFKDEKFANGIPLKYSREEFSKDINEIINALDEPQQITLLQTLELYRGNDGFEGIPIIPDKIPEKFTQQQVEALNKISERLKAFTTENECLLDDTDTKELLDALIQGLPEFTTIIGKKQHGTHAYTVDIHSLKVLQNAMNNPEYAKLSDKSKTMLKLTALTHDFGKKAAEIDDGHAALSAQYISGILEKFSFSEEEKHRIIELVSNHHWFVAYNTGNMNDKTVAALCRNPEDFEIAKILARADLEGVNDTFAFEKTSTNSPEELTSFLAEKFKYVEERLEELQKNANLVFDTRLIHKDKYPTQSALIDGEPTELKVLNLTDPNITNLEEYGYPKGTTKENARFTIHMPSDIISEIFSKFKIFQILSSLPTHHSVQSTSLVKLLNNRTYAYRKFGYILDVDQANISTANYENIGSGTEKTLDSFVDRLFSSYERSFVKNEFIKHAKMKNIEISDENYAHLTKFLYNKKYVTQIYSEFVNETVSPDKITGRTGFTKELYAEYISPKTSKTRKEEIFKLCVESKTFVIKRDGTIGIEYASKVGTNPPNDGLFRIKAKDLRELLESSRDELFRGTQHSEIVPINPRISGLIARVSSLDECPQEFLKFAKDNNLPILLIGDKVP